MTFSPVEVKSGTRATSLVLVWNYGRFCAASNSRHRRKRRSFDLQRREQRLLETKDGRVTSGARSIAE
jgi:hypothetical protein